MQDMIDLLIEELIHDITDRYGYRSFFDWDQEEQDDLRKKWRDIIEYHT